MNNNNKIDATLQKIATNVHSSFSKPGPKVGQNIYFNEKHRPTPMNPKLITNQTLSVKFR